MSAEKYKVGDRVIVKSLDWYKAGKDINGTVHVPCAFVREMSSMCGEVVTISFVGTGYYSIEEHGYMWSDEMFVSFADESFVFLKSKDVKDLPKDFAECAKVVSVTEESLVGKFRDVPSMEVEKLIICRNAYWSLSDNWNPDWKKNTKKHCVVVRNGKVGVATTISKPRQFAFPTPEMADAFGKNFKKELEANKEMLNDK